MSNRSTGQALGTSTQHRTHAVHFRTAAHTRSLACPYRSRSLLRLIRILVSEGNEGVVATVDSRELETLLDELRRHAKWLLTGERAGHSLQPTALVHEAYLRLQDRMDVKVAPAAGLRIALIQEMRRVLIDHARRRGALKRGGKGLIAVSLDDAIAVDHPEIVGVLRIEATLSKMAAEDAQAADIVVLRVYGGLTETELAAHFGLSRGWVQKKWAWARNWLRKDLLAG